MVETASHRTHGPRIQGYVQREEFIVDRCRGKRVLDLGMVANTCSETAARITTFPSSLHLKIVAVASSSVGVDYSCSEIEHLRQQYPSLCLYCGDVEHLDTVLEYEAKFDTVVMGNLIEHLSNPGRVLDHIAGVLIPGGEVIITCPNAFGLPKTLRFYIGRYWESADHVQSYTKHTLVTLLERHGYHCSSAWTALDRTPDSSARRRLYQMASPMLRLLPEVGGTLVVVANTNAQPVG